MCGICGTAGFIDETLLDKMTGIITHRGPDDSGVYLSPQAQVGLGNRRLSIIDLSSAGHMPMSNGDGLLWITFNGQLYNFRELKEELFARGHRFKSNTDTEVVLLSYQDWGISCLERFNGIFAFAI